MNEIGFLILLIFLSYIAGSFPTSIIMGRVTKDIDIRDHGSGNAGATNAFRILGWKPALVVVTIDIFKGWIPPAILTPMFFKLQIIPDVGVVQIISGFSAVFGHTYTIFDGFKGGKGVATLGGMLIALFPTVFPFCFAVAVLTILFTGYMSLASMLAAASLPIFLFILPPFLGTNPAPLSLMVFSLLVPWFITFTHRSNIQRLRSGEENRFDKMMIFNKYK